MASAAEAAPAPASQPSRAKITPFVQRRGTTEFTMSGVHVSVANAVRRTILGYLPSLGIVPFPEADTTVKVSTNTSPLHNELMKQRLASVSFHLDPDDPLVDRLEVRLKAQNTDDQTMLVTTADIVLWDTESDKALAPEAIRAILPADPVTNDHSLLVVLRPPIGAMPGDAINITATLRKVMPTDYGTYTLASTCSFGNTPDQRGREAAWKAQDLGDHPRTRALWEESTAGEYAIPESYDFKLRAVGWMDEQRLLVAALAHMQDQLTILGERGEAGNLNVTKVKNVVAPHTFDIEIPGDTYTFGHCLRHELYVSECGPRGRLLVVGFDKQHAHDENGSLRVVFWNDASAVNASHMVARAARTVAAVFLGLLKQQTPSA